MGLAEFLLARIAEEEAEWREHNAIGMNEVSPFLRLCAAWRRDIADAQEFSRSHGVPVHATALRILADQYADHPDYRQEW